MSSNLHNCRYLLMNTSSPKLLVIPTPSANLERGEPSEAQEKELLYIRKKQTLRARLMQLASEVWVVLSRDPKVRSAGFS